MGTTILSLISAEAERFQHYNIQIILEKRYSEARGQPLKNHNLVRENRKRSRTE